MARLEYQQADKTAIRLPVRATSALPAATQFAFRLAGLPVLCTSFWLQLEAPFTAALTVARF